MVTSHQEDKTPIQARPRHKGSMIAQLQSLVGITPTFTLVLTVEKFSSTLLSSQNTCLSTVEDVSNTSDRNPPNIIQIEQSLVFWFRWYEHFRSTSTKYILNWAKQKDVQIYLLLHLLLCFYNIPKEVGYGTENAFWFPIPNKFSNNFGAIGGRFIGTGAMKLTIFSWTLYLNLDIKGNQPIRSWNRLFSIYRKTWNLDRDNYLIFRLFDARRSTIFRFLGCSRFKA